MFLILNLEVKFSEISLQSSIESTGSSFCPMKFVYGSFCQKFFELLKIKPDFQDEIISQYDINMTHNSIIPPYTDFMDLVKVF